LSLTIEVRVWSRHGCPLDASPGAAGELPRRSCRATHHRPDLVERHVEHVVQHEGQSLGWGQRLEHDLQREADRAGL
jgi:hypothetical protein